MILLLLYICIYVQELIAHDDDHVCACTHVCVLVSVHMSADDLAMDRLEWKNRIHVSDPTIVGTRAHNTVERC